MVFKNLKLLIKIERYVAFTLAEVLITLGIIGVVAQMTIPTLVENVQDQAYKTAYKKAFSELSQAYEMASSNNEIPLRNPQTKNKYDPVGDPIIFNALKSHFSVVQDYSDTGDNSACWPKPASEAWVYWNAPISTAPCFIDKSGMAWALWQETPDHSYPHLLVDTNGPNKGPNYFGKDRFPIVGKTDDTAVMLLGYKFASDIIDQSSSEYYVYLCPHYPCYFTTWMQE